MPHSFLKQGQNSVLVSYTGTYSHTGEGLHRFEDPVDKRVYMYTQFEDFDANRFMPCFDQPDLKATLQMTVRAPEKWTIISNTLEDSKKKVSKTMRYWVFPRTAKISTYLFALHAGDYQVWSSSYGKIPLRLFARKSLAKYVVPENWFKVTRAGLGFYQNYFGYDYPFKKYDQIIVPEFNAGAMENVAAVTFTERYISRSKETVTQLSNTASTVLHEMAHMWFGDLVTMKWWNDLWLNESFATYMSNLASNGATEFKDADLDFFAYGKQGAYLEDQLVTTHPIEANIKNTDESFTNFDSITYGKGASVFKQLSYSIGADKFREGVRTYFKKYAYKNTKLSDFMAELGAASGQNLDEWSRDWLRDAGVDTLKYKIKCDAQKISSFDLELNPADTSKYTRTHAFQVGFINLKGNTYSVTQSLRVVMSQKTMSLKEAIGFDCPAMVFPNYKDYDYAKFELDSVTVANLKASFTKIEDPLLRIMFAGTLWQMVRDQKLKLSDYIAVALSAIASENDQKIISYINASLTGGKRTDENSAFIIFRQKQMLKKYNA